MDPHPWRTARKGAWTLRTLGGRSFEISFAIIGLLIARRFGWPDLAAAVLAAFGGLVVAPLLEIVWRRIRGPVGELDAQNAEHIRRIDGLQAKVRALEKAQGTPKIEVRSPWLVLMSSNPDFHKIAVTSVVTVFTLRDVRVINRHASDAVELDFVLRLQLSAPSKSGRVFMDLKAITDTPESYREIDPVHLAPQASAMQTLVFYLSDLHRDGLTNGTQSIAADGHDLIVQDWIADFRLVHPIPQALGALWPGARPAPPPPP